MDKEQASWLIVRALGLYLLIQAFFLAVGVLGEVYMYSRLSSSPGAQNDYLTAMIRTYRVSMLASLSKFVVFSVIGIYFLRGGRFLMRWLQHVPETPHHETKAPLTEQEARNLSINERLSAAGLFNEFADAVDRHDISDVERILRQIYLAPDDIQAVIAKVLRTS